MADKVDRVRGALTNASQAAVLTQAEQPARTKGRKPAGRPRTILVQRVKVSMWVVKSQWDELQQIIYAERARGHKATATDLVGEALRDLITKRRRK